MRIGILGGTFNPIHIGHLILAEEAFFKLKLDKLIVVPAYVPPHKSAENVISSKHRLSMVKLAIEDNPSFEFSTFETDSKKKSYSIDTISPGSATSISFIIAVPHYAQILPTYGEL